MDEKITDVLTILDREDSPSQREIAKQTGFSVGLVNTLIKKCAKKGLVKIERLNSRNIKYILTPEGIKEKTQKTIDYIKRSYQAIQQLQNRVTELALKHSSEGKEIYLSLIHI
jgi:DNA-binding MarR family transcriptional regulator